MKFIKIVCQFLPFYIWFFLEIFTENEISKVYIFFPDPWENKDRQKKHKLMQMEFLDKMYFVLKK